MPEGLVPRMAIEWGFLILLAIGAGIADLRPLLIVLVLAIGWVLVALVELIAWRARPSYAVTEEVVGSEPAPAAFEPLQAPIELPPVEEPLPVVQEEPPPPAAEPEAPPVRAEQEPPPAAPTPPAYHFEFTRPAAAAQEASAPAAEGHTSVFAPEPEEPEAGRIDPDDPYAPAPERERLREVDQRVVHRLEPLKPRPKRRWFSGRRGETGIEEEES